MAITTYSELQSAVAGWLNRTDLTARIPEFIAVGEAKLNRRLRIMDQLAVIDFLVDAEYMDVPVDWAQTANIEHDSLQGGEIEYLTPQKFLATRRCVAPTGKPEYYTLAERQMRFAPVPGEPQPTILQYYRLVPPLTDAAPTNWLLTRHPDVYLAAALLAANTFLRDMEGVALATAELADVISSIQLADQQDRTSTTPLMRAQPI